LITVHTISFSKERVKKDRNKRCLLSNMTCLITQVTNGSARSKHIILISYFILTNSEVVQVVDLKLNLYGNK